MPTFTEQFRVFSPETFCFFTELATHNTKDWFSANRQRFTQHVDLPLRAIITALAPFLDRRCALLETAAKCGKTLSRINKNIFRHVEEGRYNKEYWAAFYRTSLTKQTDIQLFLSVHSGGFDAGLHCSYRAKSLLEAFRTQILNNKERFFALLQHLPFSLAIYTMEGREQPLVIECADDLEQVKQGNCLAILRRWYPEHPLLFSPRLIPLLEQTFEVLLPLYQNVVGEKDQLLSFDQVMEFPEDDIVLQETYDLEDLKQDTYLEEELILGIEHLLMHKKQLIFYGPPGTGKTYLAKRFAQYFLAGKGESKIIQFHPSYAYEDFIEGIRPQTERLSNGQTVLTYAVMDGVFKKFCQQARRSGRDARFVLIIDEINRGNLAKVFGELLYLLEYRNASVELPYSKMAFQIPNNVYLIGTMNTADRSIALVDHALRRRFHFIHLSPNITVLRRFLEEHRPQYVWVAELLVRLNTQLQAHGVGREYHIGQSHFMSHNLDEEQLRLIWRFTILPTIEEYFHHRADLIAKYDLQELARGLGEQEILSA